MFERYLFRLNIAVSIGLKSISGLKGLAVRFHKYEFANSLSKIEQHFLSIEQELGPGKSPEVTLTKGLTPKGASFYNEIFTYAIFHNWKDIPPNFIVLLKERKDELNEIFKFDEDTLKPLGDLNKRLYQLEAEIQSLFKPTKEYPEFIPPGSLTIKCFTHSSFYDLNTATHYSDAPFYQIQFSLTDFLESIPVYNHGDGLPNVDISSHLPPTFRDEKICLLFALLAADGLLAWEDFMNIDRVEIDLDLKYKFL